MSASVNHEVMPKKRFEFLDGIRGWAALIVVFGHTMVGVIALDAPDFVHQIYLKFITHAYLSVMIFFVLSGYVLSISQILTTKRNLAITTVARYFRLLIPVFVVTVIAYLFLKMGFFYNVESSTTEEAKSWLGRFYTFSPDIIDALRFAFFDTFFNYDGQHTYNSSLWTMPVEMMGSILIYSYIAIFRVMDKIYWLVAAVLVVYFYNVSPYMFCFMAGYMLAELKIRQRNFTNGITQVLLVLLFIGVIFYDTFNRPATDQGNCLEAVILIFCISYSQPLMHFFSNSFSKYLGRISFSLYLIQIVVICSWSSYLRIHLPAYGFGIYVDAIINLISTIAICIGFAHLLTPVDIATVKYSKIIARKILYIKTGETKPVEIG